MTESEMPITDVLDAAQNPVTIALPKTGHRSGVVGRRILQSALPFVVVAIAWLVITGNALVDPSFVPSISAVGRALVSLFVHDGYMADVWVSIYRVMAAFVASALIAI